MFSFSAFGMKTFCLWHFAHEASVILVGSIGKSHWCGSSQWNFFSHSTFFSSVDGECCASRKLIDWPEPSWHTVQPTRSIGCGEALPMYWSRLGCVVNGCGYFS